MRIPKKAQALVVGVAAVAALSITGMAFAAAGGGSTISWSDLKDEQAPVPIEQYAQEETELASTGDAVDPKAADVTAKASTDTPAATAEPTADPEAVEPVAEPAGKAAEDPSNGDKPAGTPAPEDGGKDAGAPSSDTPAVPGTEGENTENTENGESTENGEEPPAEVEAAPTKVSLTITPADAATVTMAGATHHDGATIDVDAPADVTFSVTAAEGFRVASVTVVKTAAPAEGDAASAPAEAEVVEPGADGAYAIAVDEGIASCAVAVTLEESGIVNYANLKAAFEQGGAVALEGDIAVEGPLSVSAAAPVELDLAGHVLTVADEDAEGNPVTLGAGDSLITVEPGASLVITDSTAPLTLTPQCRGEERAVQAATAGKLGTYDAAAKELVYYVTTTKTNRVSGTTSETRHENHLNLANVGAIEAKGLGSLVSVADGATLTVTAGRLTNEGGAHAVQAGNATVSLQGTAALVGSGNAGKDGATDNGAGVYQTAGTLSISGNAVVGGNKAANNGGGVYLGKGTLAVSGATVVAGNYAGTGEAQQDDGAEHPDTFNGGGIYAGVGTVLTLSDEAVIAGNRAQRDGGGIYLAPQKANASKSGTSSKFEMAAGTITNNRADGYKANSAWATTGGGGVFLMADATITGGVISSNYAMDAGGGVCVPGEDAYASTLLKVSNAVVCGNWAESSEGDGMFCLTAGKKALDANAGRLSFVTTGTYITNNHTNTEYDYGGGGLFVPSSGYLNVVYPVVTGNEARGFGGGVAACSNSTVITQDAAIFDNKAKGENHTTNPNEYGDKWAMLAEGTGPGPQGNNLGDRTWTVGATKLDKGTETPYDAYTDYQTLTYLGYQNEDGTVTPLEADDFFSANDATVYGKMLGSHEASCPENCTEDHRSAYNWTGWMSASPAQGTAKVVYGGWGKAATITMPDGTTYKFNSGGPRANNLGWYMWIKAADYTEEEAEEIARSLDGLAIDFSSPASKFTTGLTGFYAAGLQKENGLYGFDFKRYADGGELMGEDGTLANEGLYLAADGTELAPRELEAATRTDKLAYYRVYHIDQFPEGEGYAHATRIMGLNAHPDAAAKVSARSAARVFVTGNSSNTNGGGIGCNGFIHIGRPDPGTPDQENPPSDPTHYGAFRLDKTTVGFPVGEDGVMSSGRVTAVFHVVGYEDEASASKGEGHNVIYDAYHAMEFDANETQELVLGRFPAGSYFLITEVAYSGAGYDVDGTGTKGITIAATDEDAQPQDLPGIAFTNTYKEGGHYTTGVVNAYTRQDGEYTVTQKWSKTQIVVPAPEEGDEQGEDPQQPADES